MSSCVVAEEFNSVHIRKKSCSHEIYVLLRYSIYKVHRIISESENAVKKIEYNYVLKVMMRFPVD